MRWRHANDGAPLYFGWNSLALASQLRDADKTIALSLPTIYAGGYVSLMGKIEIEGLLKRAQAETITHTMLVPVQYRRLMQYPHFDRYDLSALQMKFCTSAPFPAELKAEVLNRFAGGMIESYGMTEGGL